MKSLKGTQTEKNILTAFAGESQARNRYDFFAAKAKSDGYVLVRDIFQETALQEKEHAKRLFKILEGGDVKIVDVNIRRLRMKVEDEPSHPTHIMTVWGYGYRWEE